MIMQIYGERTLRDWPHVNARHSHQRPLLTLVRILASISVATTPNFMVSDVQRCPKTRRRTQKSCGFRNSQIIETSGLVEHPDRRVPSVQKITGGLSAVVR